MGSSNGKHRGKESKGQQHSWEEVRVMKTTRGCSTMVGEAAQEGSKERQSVEWGNVIAQSSAMVKGFAGYHRCD